MIILFIYFFGDDLVLLLLSLFFFPFIFISWRLITLYNDHFKAQNENP